jgi:L-threonylcarbamoyladenylate synthase
MDTIVLARAAPRAIEWAAEALVSGQVVAFPTDTVYGLAASLAHQEALRRVYEIKGRPDDKPLPVLVSSVSALAQVALDLDDRVRHLVARYWPGPLTIVVAAKQGMPAETLGPDRTVGVRLPNHPLALEVIERAGGALAVTSANRSGEPPARTGDEVMAALGGSIDMLLDGGVTPGGVPSTVIAFDGEHLRVLREGALPGEHLRASWRDVVAGSTTHHPIP